MRSAARARLATARAAALCLAAAWLAAGYQAVAQTPGGQPHPWRVGDPAPAIEGIHLGDPEARVIAVLGPPAASPLPVDPAAPLRALRYRDGGLIVGVGRIQGVVRILLRRPQGGALAGVRVGDRLGALIRLWGEPPAGAGSVGRYPMGSWTVTVRGDMGSNRVLGIVLSRSLPPPAPAVAPALVLPGPPRP